MKQQQLSGLLVVIFSAFFLLSCETRQPETVTQPTPQVFTPGAEEDSVAAGSDTVSATPLPASPEEKTAAPEPAPKRLPTVAELKKVTPGQEAKRALSNDAMQIYRMKPDAFQDYMESRIPYYRGKGDLKAENDLVRLEITEKEMRIQTPRGLKTFPMQ